MFAPVPLLLVEEQLFVEEKLEQVDVEELFFVEGEFEQAKFEEVEDLQAEFEEAEGLQADYEEVEDFHFYSKTYCFLTDLFLQFGDDQFLCLSLLLLFQEKDLMPLLPLVISDGMPIRLLLFFYLISDILHYNLSI